jgi:hypothetical protein
MAWDTWKKSFDTWEDRTAKFLEVSLKNPLVLRPAAAALTASLRAKAAADKLTTYVVGRLGLPTKADQERTLHAIYRLESRLIDLEEKLDEAHEEALSASHKNATEDHAAPTLESTSPEAGALSAKAVTPTTPLAKLHVENRK